MNYKVGDEVWLFYESNYEIIKGVIERISNWFGSKNSEYYVIKLERKNYIGEDSTIYEDYDTYVNLFVNHDDAVNYAYKQLDMNIEYLENKLTKLKIIRDNLQN